MIGIRGSFFRWQRAAAIALLLAGAADGAEAAEMRISGDESLSDRITLADPQPPVVPITATPASGYAPLLVSTGLVLHYTFDTNYGAVVSDESGSGNNATVTGATWVTNGVSGGAYRFDGDGDYLKARDSPSLRVQANTVAAWVKTATAFAADEARPIVTKEKYLGAAGYTLGQFYAYGTNYKLMEGGEKGKGYHDTIAPMMPQTGRWCFVVGTFDGSTRRIYIDGKLQTSIDEPLTITHDSTNLFVGGYVTGPPVYWNGLIDDVRIYNRALSSNEVLDLYTTTPSFPLPKAAFTATPVSGVPPLAVTFTDSSTGRLASRVWDFNGDGVADATNPATPIRYTYSTGGVYSVRLTVSGQDGWDAISHDIACIDLAVGLVAHYPLDGNAQDVSSNGYHGTIVGTLTAATDRKGTPSGAYAFAQSGYIVYAAGPVAALASQEHSVSCWVKSLRTEALAEGVAGYWSDGGGRGYGIDIYESSGRLGFIEGTDQWGYGYAFGDSVIRGDGVWHHVVGIRRSGVTRLYVDGVLQASSTTNAVSFGANCRIYLGLDTPYYTYHRLTGSLDDVRFYGRALSQEEVLLLYTNSPPVPPVEDADGDGMGDAWEEHYFGGTNTASQSSDSDDDGVRDWAEYVAGTCPTSSDAFSLGLALSNEQLIVSFLGRQTQSNWYGPLTRLYRLESAEQLSPTGWIGLQDYTNVPGADRLIEYTNPAPATSMFYRAKVRLQ